PWGLVAGEKGHDLLPRSGKGGAKHGRYEGDKHHRADGPLLPFPKLSSFGFDLRDTILETFNLIRRGDEPFNAPVDLLLRLYDAVDLGFEPSEVALNVVGHHVSLARREASSRAR